MLAGRSRQDYDLKADYKQSAKLCTTLCNGIFNVGKCLSQWFNLPLVYMVVYGFFTLLHLIQSWFS